MSDKPIEDADLAGEPTPDEAVAESHDERIRNARRARSAWPVAMTDVDGELKIA